MPSVLIISPDATSINTLEKLVKEHGCRARSVTEIHVAREWLEIQHFDMVLVDAEIQNIAPIDLLRHGWKHNGMLIGGIFSFTGRVPDEWEARIAGARIYQGTGASESIGGTLDSLSNILFDPNERAIMFIDDLDSPREIICSYIEALGYPQVVGQSSGKDALTELKKNSAKYFCVISDINMPHMNGVEFVKELRAIPSIAKLPVIMLTAYATAENLIDCVREGATGFLVKPPRKLLLQRELDKAKRIYVTNASPRLCRAEDADLLEDALDRLLRMP